MFSYTHSLETGQLVHNFSFNMLSYNLFLHFAGLIFLFFFRLSWCLFCFHQVCNSRTWWDLGISAILWSLYLREIRHRQRRWHLPSIRTGWRLRSITESQPKMQIIRKDEQDSPIPWLLSTIWMRTRCKTRISRNPNNSYWI